MDNFNNELGFNPDSITEITKLLPSPENKRFLMEVAMGMAMDFIKNQPADSWKDYVKLEVRFYTELCEYLMSSKF